MTMRRSTIYKFAGLVVAALGLLSPIVAIGLLIAGVMGAYQLLFSEEFVTALVFLILSPVLVVPCGIGLYAYGKFSVNWYDRKRGLCPACAYPVGTSPVCTECGKPVDKWPAVSDQRSDVGNGLGSV